MSIDPETGDVEAATFTDVTKAERWIARRNGKVNLYLCLNVASKTTGWKGRLTKKDVTQVAGQHIDIDLDKLPATHPWYALDLAERKVAMLDVLRAFKEPGPPSVIIDSGGGLQCYWLYDAPAPVTSDSAAERANAHLIELLGGDPSTFPISQPLRLPGSWNLPDARKKARGREKTMAVLVEFNDRRYCDAEFDLAPPRPQDTLVDVEIGEPEEVEDLDALFDRHHVPARVRRIVREGPLPDQPKANDNSHSAWVLDAACGLVRCGVPDAQIVAILLDEDLGIGRDDERQAYRAVRKANRLVSAEKVYEEAAVIEVPGEPLDEEELYG
jgi:hypothetical protein